MKLELVRANCVAVGTFNIYILHPQWMSQEGIIPKGTEVALEASLEQPGMHFSYNKIKWMVKPNSLAIESENVSDDCGAPMAQILQKLPFTSLVALGCNFTFEVPAQSFDKQQLKRLCPQIRPPRGFTEKNKGFHLALERGLYLYRVSFAQTKEKVTVVVNVHAELRDKDKSLITQAAKDFSTHRKTAQNLAKKILMQGGV